MKIRPGRSIRIYAVAEEDDVVYVSYNLQRAEQYAKIMVNRNIPHRLLPKTLEDAEIQAMNKMGIELNGKEDDLDLLSCLYGYATKYGSICPGGPLQAGMFPGAVSDPDEDARLLRMLGKNAKNGQRLRELRLRHGISQGRMGEIVGLTTGRISQIERGQGSREKEEEIIRLFLEKNHAAQKRTL